MRVGVAVLIAIICVLAGRIASSGTWECDCGNTYKAKCYVNYVRYIQDGSNMIIEAGIFDPWGGTPGTQCEELRVKVGGYPSYTTTEGDVRAAQAVLITALTTGYPIQFYKVGECDATSDCCYTNAIRVHAPGW